MAEVDPTKNGNSSNQQLANGSNPDEDRAIDAGEGEIEAASDPSGARSEAQMGEGNRTFTMRELLNELKEDGIGSVESEGNKNGGSSSFRFVTRS